MTMKRLISTLWLISTLTAGGAWAQPYAPNAAGVTMGHWHLNSRATRRRRSSRPGRHRGRSGLRARDISRRDGIDHGAAPAPPAPPDRSSTTSVSWSRMSGESVAKWKAAGVPVEPGGNNRLDQAWVITPDGLRVEIRATVDPDPHEHVHFSLPEATIPQSQAWYGKFFDAKAGVRTTRRSPTSRGPSCATTRSMRAAAPPGRIPTNRLRRTDRRPS